MADNDRYLSILKRYKMCCFFTIIRILIVKCFKYSNILLKNVIKMQHAKYNFSKC